MPDYQANQAIWRLNEKVKCKTQSQLELKRNRCDSLEIHIKEIIHNLEKLKALNFESGIVYGYLNWIVTILNRSKKGALSTEEYEDLNIKTRIIEKRLQRIFSKQSLITTNYAPTIDTFKPKQAFDYNKFIQNGLNSFVILIDSYQLWLEPKDLRKIVLNSVPDALTYVLIASLAKFTLPKDDPFCHLICKQNIKNAKKLLPQAYLNPSYDNVVALGLMTHISLANFNANDVIRYFSMAISMAQTLGYDRIEDCDNNTAQSTKECLRDKFKGKRLWGALSMTYLILFSIIPEFPSLNFTPKVVSLIHPSKDHFFFDTSLQLQNGDPFQSTREVLLASSVGNKMTELFLKVTTHIQNARLNAPLGDVSKVSPESLRLPPKEFNKVLTSLMSFQMSISEPSERFKSRELTEYRAKVFPENDATNSTFISYFQVLTKILYIYLYYPSVLIYPRPVDFSIEEAELLFQAANCISKHFKQVNIQFESYDLNNVNKKDLKAKNLFFKYNRNSIYFIQSSYPIFIYFNIITKYNLGEQVELYSPMVEYSKINALNLLKFLNYARRFINQDKFFGPSCTLTFIKRAISRYYLPNDFYSQVLEYF